MLKSAPNMIDTWNGVFGKHGVGKFNDNGLSLLSLCSEIDLTVTDTCFRLA